MASPSCSSPKKRFVSADALYRQSRELGIKILQNGFRPTWLLALWRGGCPPAMNVHEVFKQFGLKVDHIACRTSAYEGTEPNKQGTVRVHGLEYLLKKIRPEDRLLIVDDVFDRGRTTQAVINKIRRKTSESNRQNCPTEIRVATVFYKPDKNETFPRITPDYFAETVPADEWIVFPHELEGLSLDEISQFYGYGVALFFASLPAPKKERVQEPAETPTKTTTLK
jgi:hypoxanthine phosphoribosyltransferase